MPTQYIEKVLYIEIGILQQEKKGIRKAILQRNSKRITTKLIARFNLLYNLFIYLFYMLKEFYYLYVFFLRASATIYVTAIPSQHTLYFPFTLVTYVGSKQIDLIELLASSSKKQKKKGECFSISMFSICCSTATTRWNTHARVHRNLRKQATAKLSNLRNTRNIRKQ